MQRSRLLIILAAVLGVLTLGVVAFLVLSGGLLGGGGETAETTPEATPGSGPGAPEQAPPQQTIRTTQVIVALQPIARGEPFVQGSIGPRDWPADNVPPDIIALEAETVGKVAKTEIVQGQVIVRSMLADIAGAGEASFLIDPGRVAVPYPIQQETSVAYAVKEGDYVDVLITAFFVDVDEEFQAKLPNKLQFFTPDINTETGELLGTFTLSDPVDEGRFEIASGDLPAIVYARETQIPRRVAQLTVPAAKVIKVGPWIEPPPPPPQQQQQEGEGPPPTPTPNLPKIITLAVEPQDALVLLWLRQSGIYSELALRAAGDQNAEHITEAVTLQYMLTRFNIAVPPKIEFVMSASIAELEKQGQDTGVAEAVVER
jgi:Flp pilus assembly protein CpaB